MAGARPRPSAPPHGGAVPSMAWCRRSRTSTMPATPPRTTSALAPILAIPPPTCPRTTTCPARSPPRPRIGHARQARRLGKSRAAGTLLRDQHLALVGVIRRADDALLLHLLYEPRG